MNQYQLELFNKLVSLVSLNNSFYTCTHTLHDSKYIVFTYRLASYTDFLVDGALESRGIMFEIDEHGNPIKLVSMPMEKFFNVNENPSTMNLNFNDIKVCELKADGSLISTFNKNNKLYLKSKTSIRSDVALDAYRWLRQPENLMFYDQLLELDMAGYTVNMEWCSPTNQIVISYQEPHLAVLNIRNRMDGSYLEKENIDPQYNEILNRYIQQHVPENPTEWVNAVYDITDNIEGFVIIFNSGLRAKIKTKKYSALHKLKNNITTPRRLYECILAEGVDDLRAFFYDNPTALEKINTMENYVCSLFNELVESTDHYYTQNKDLSRKDYAIKAKAELPSANHFNIAMGLYLNKQIDVKEYMLKRWKELGIKDEKYNDIIEEDI
jgi:T4 RnlA family RNA ligase